MVFCGPQFALIPRNSKIKKERLGQRAEWELCLEGSSRHGAIVIGYVTEIIAMRRNSMNNDSDDNSYNIT